MSKLWNGNDTLDGVIFDGQKDKTQAEEACSLGCSWIVAFVCVPQSAFSASDCYDISLRASNATRKSDRYRALLMNQMLHLLVAWEWRFPFLHHGHLAFCSQPPLASLC